MVEEEKEIQEPEEPQNFWIAFLLEYGWIIVIIVVVIAIVVLLAFGK